MKNPPQKSFASKTFSKDERLKSNKLIETLLESGSSFNEPPFRILWLRQELMASYPVQICISVPKRSFPKATDRNKIKRKIREAYRLSKQVLYKQLSEKNVQLVLMLIFTGKFIPEYADLEAKMNKLFSRLLEEYEKTDKASC